ncbi:interferon beta [Manis javanica]|uniref:interferon beta n=1 Tax=Manis javanica TaxID=9974 RepID=UPI000812E01B|nr:interferon beta [Manis javanica]KAI5942082.1 Interferon beta [Manis javanica]
MTNRYILPVALLLYFSTTALSGSYNLLRFQLRSSSLVCVELLRQLNGSPQYCLKDRMNFEAPEEIERSQQFQKEDAVLVIHEMLQQIFGIFRRNFSRTGWNETVVENLLSELYVQMNHLETILEESTEEENFWENMTIVHLKRYYLRLVRYLKAKEYSRCAWTVVQVEVLRNFSFLDSLTNYLLN